MWLGYTIMTVKHTVTLASLEQRQVDHVNLCKRAAERVRSRLLDKQEGIQKRITSLSSVVAGLKAKKGNLQKKVELVESDLKGRITVVQTTYTNMIASRDEAQANRKTTRNWRQLFSWFKVRPKLAAAGVPDVDSPEGGVQ